MRRTLGRSLWNLVCLVALILSGADVGFAGILYGGGQPIENNFAGVKGTLRDLEGAAGGLARRYQQEGVADGSRLAGSLLEESVTLREVLLRTEGSMLDPRAVLDVAIASSTTVDVVDFARESLGRCGLCNLGLGTFDSVDRVLAQFTVQTAVLGDLLPLRLLPDFSPVLPAPPIPWTMPPITGGRPSETGLPSLSGEVARVLETYRGLGDARGAELARSMADAVEDLAGAADTAIAEITTHGLTPQNATVIFDAFAGIRDALARLEQAVVRAEDCCEASPGLLAPVRTLLGHVRIQVGALADAALDTIGLELLMPAEGEPPAYSSIPIGEFVRGALADAQPIIDSAGSIYRHLGSARGEQLAGAVGSALRALPAAISAFEEEPTAGHLEAVTSALDEADGALDDLEDCCNAIPGLLAPSRHALSRVRSHWQRLRDLRVAAVVHELTPQNALVPELVAAHWRSTVAELSSLAARGATRYRALGNEGGAALVEALSAHGKEIDIESFAAASHDSARASALGHIGEALSSIEEMTSDVDACCALAPAIARLRTTAGLMSQEVETLQAGLIPAGPFFVRGDVNADGTRDVSDPISILVYLFHDGATLCLKAADTNDDGTVDISDALPVIQFLFIGGAPLPDPSVSCGEDPTADDLPCATQPECADIIP